jgi:hypothetical protein
MQRTKSYWLHLLQRSRSQDGAGAV